jgi:hypothetical protein
MSSADAKRLKRLSYAVISKLQNLEIGRKLQSSSLSSQTTPRLPREYITKCEDDLCVNKLLASLRELLYTSVATRDAPGLPQARDRFFSSMDGLISEVRESAVAPSTIRYGVVTAVLKHHQRLFKIVDDNDLSLSVQPEVLGRVLNLQVRIWENRAPGRW